MLKIQDAVEEVLYADEEALHAMAHGYMNLSGYAERIHRRIERETKKELTIPTIVVALSRLRKKMRKKHSPVVEVIIHSVNSKSPVTELVYDKSDAMIKRLGNLRDNVDATSDDFLSITIGTNEISVICSDRVLKAVRDHFSEEPREQEGDLAIVSLVIDPSQYWKPGISYSLLRKVAQKGIVLAETLTIYGEVIFAFKKEHLSEMLGLFSANSSKVTQRI